VADITNQLELHAVQVNPLSAAKGQPDEFVDVVGEELFITVPREADRVQGVLYQLVMRLVERAHLSLGSIKTKGEFRSMAEGDLADLNAALCAIDDHGREGVTNERAARHITTRKSKISETIAGDNCDTTGQARLQQLPCHLKRPKPASTVVLIHLIEKLHRSKQPLVRPTEVQDRGPTRCILGRQAMNIEKRIDRLSVIALRKKL
jgi:hypothetical protein